MSELVSKLVFSLALIIILTLLSWFMKTYLSKLLTATVNNLVQLAEAQIQGSGLGATKKAWVIAQLEATNIKVTVAINALIDQLVAVMNDKKTSILDAVSDAMDTG